MTDIGLAIWFAMLRRRSVGLEGDACLLKLEGGEEDEEEEGDIVCVMRCKVVW